jgi:hypothetical protein
MMRAFQHGGDHQGHHHRGKPPSRDPKISGDVDMLGISATCPIKRGFRKSFRRPDLEASKTPPGL